MSSTIGVADDLASELLMGVDMIPKVGTPGTLITVGKEAHPIIVGTNPHEVILAAATYEEGRIIVFGHEGYLNRFMKPCEASRTLVDNLQHWLAKGKVTDVSSEVVRIDGATSFPTEDDVKIVVWKGEHLDYPDIVSDIRKFVAKGGGLVTGYCPWGYLQINSHLTLQDVGSYALLKDVGVHFTTDFVRGHSDGFQLPSNTTNMAHFHRNLVRMNKLEEALCWLSSVVARGISNLPSSVVLSEEIFQHVEEVYQDLQKILDKSPPLPKKPVSLEVDRITVVLFNDILFHHCKNPPPGVSTFPGVVNDKDAVPESVTIEKHSNGKKKDPYPTGYYIPPATRVKVAIKSDLDRENPWSIMIGCHTDDNSKLDSYRRYPKLSVKKLLCKTEMDFMCPFGGLVYLLDPGKKDDVITLTIESAIKSPNFDVCDPSSAENWLERRQAPGLWADLDGKHIMLTMPAASVREVTDPGVAMTFWDDVVEAHHELRGTSPQGGRKEWVVTDEQPVAGYMHAGYPIVTHLDVADPKHKNFLLSSTQRQDGNWGMFHEIGHNMQRSEWTFNGTKEVTCNIFTLHALDTVCGQAPWICKWLQNNLPKALDYLKAGADFAVWKKEPGVALFIYAQLQACFGWEPYKSVFREYEAQRHETKPKTEEAKIDTWITRFSNTVGFNLIPLFRFWGFAITDKLEEELGQLQPFLPNDDLTRAVPDRTKCVVSAYKTYVTKYIESGVPSIE